MDGSVSTLAPLFAAAFATHNTCTTPSGSASPPRVGAGISMGFAEALSDDGSLTGRGHPWMRGVVCGLMTTLGGIGHTLPYLIPDFRTATTVADRRGGRRTRRHRLDPQPLHGHAVPASPPFQVVVGGVLVFLAGILIGSALYSAAQYHSPHSTHSRRATPSGHQRQELCPQNNQFCVAQLCDCRRGLQTPLCAPSLTHWSWCANDNTDMHPH